jgi:uncharacterized membrane protein required for colicin V production
LIRYLLLITIFFAPAFFFATGGDYIAATICVMASLGALSGYQTGAAFMFASLAALAAAFTFAPTLGPSYELQFSEFFGTTGLTNRFLSVGAIGVLVLFAIAGGLLLIMSRVLDCRPGLERLNRCLGLGIGAVQGPAAVFFLLGGFLIIESMEQNRPADQRRPIVSNLVLKTTELTRQSQLGPTIVAYNPFTRIPQLNKLQQVHRSVQVLRDPAQIQGVLNHPSIRQLQRRPEVREAIEKLAADPAIQELLHSGKKMDRSMAMLLLSHPAVMELVDQPGFLEEASQVINGAHQTIQ